MLLQTLYNFGHRFGRINPLQRPDPLPQPEPEDPVAEMRRKMRGFLDTYAGPVQQEFPDVHTSQRLSTLDKLSGQKRDEVFPPGPLRPRTNAAVAADLALSYPVRAAAGLVDYMTDDKQGGLAETLYDVADHTGPKPEEYERLPLWVKAGASLVGSMAPIVAGAAVGGPIGATMAVGNVFGQSASEVRQQHEAAEQAHRERVRTGKAIEIDRNWKPVTEKEMLYDQTIYGAPMAALESLLPLTLFKAGSRMAPTAVAETLQKLGWGSKWFLRSLTESLEEGGQASLANLARTRRSGEDFDRPEFRADLKESMQIGAIAGGQASVAHSINPYMPYNAGPIPQNPETALQAEYDAVQSILTDESGEARFKTASVRLRDGTVHPGALHFIALSDAVSKGLDVEGAEDGWTDYDDNFFTRDEVENMEDVDSEGQFGEPETFELIAAGELADNEPALVERETKLREERLEMEAKLRKALGMAPQEDVYGDGTTDTERIEELQGKLEQARQEHDEGTQNGTPLEIVDDPKRSVFGDESGEVVFFEKEETYGGSYEFQFTLTSPNAEHPVHGKGSYFGSEMISIGVLNYGDGSEGRNENDPVELGMGALIQFGEYLENEFPNALSVEFSRAGSSVHIRPGNPTASGRSIPLRRNIRAAREAMTPEERAEARAERGQDRRARVEQRERHAREAREMEAEREEREARQNVIRDRLRDIDSELERMELNGTLMTGPGLSTEAVRLRYEYRRLAPTANDYGGLPTVPHTLRNREDRGGRDPGEEHTESPSGSTDVWVTWPDVHEIENATPEFIEELQQADILDDRPLLQRMRQHIQSLNDEYGEGHRGVGSDGWYERMRMNVARMRESHPDAAHQLERILTSARAATAQMEQEAAGLAPRVTLGQPVPAGTRPPRTPTRLEREETAARAKDDAAAEAAREAGEYELETVDEATVQIEAAEARVQALMNLRDDIDRQAATARVRGRWNIQEALAQRRDQVQERLNDAGRRAERVTYRREILQAEEHERVDRSNRDLNNGIRLREAIHEREVYERAAREAGRDAYADDYRMQRGQLVNELNELSDRQDDSEGFSRRINAHPLSEVTPPSMEESPNASPGAYAGSEEQNQSIDGMPAQQERTARLEGESLDDARARRDLLVRDADGHRAAGRDNTAEEFERHALALSREIRAAEVEQENDDIGVANLTGPEQDQRIMRISGELNRVENLQQNAGPGVYDLQIRTRRDALTRAQNLRADAINDELDVLAEDRDLLIDTNGSDDIEVTNVQDQMDRLTSQLGGLRELVEIAENQRRMEMQPDTRMEEQTEDEHIANMEDSYEYEVGNSAGRPRRIERMEQHQQNLVDAAEEYREEGEYEEADSMEYLAGEVAYNISAEQEAEEESHPRASVADESMTAAAESGPTPPWTEHHTGSFGPNMPRTAGSYVDAIGISRTSTHTYSLPYLRDVRRGREVLAALGRDAGGSSVDVRTHRTTLQNELARIEGRHNSMVGNRFEETIRAEGHDPLVRGREINARLREIRFEMGERIGSVEDLERELTFLHEELRHLLTLHGTEWLDQLAMEGEQIGPDTQGSLDL